MISMSRDGWAPGPACMLILAVISVPAARAQTVSYEAIADVWLRASSPDATYEDDYLSVWSSATGNQRYGIVEFDVSSLAGKNLVSAELRLFQGTWDRGHGQGIRQTAHNIDSAQTPALNTTWNSYFVEKDATKQPFEGLGRYDLPPVDPANTLYQSSAATSADLALLEAEANGDGLLTLVLIPDEDDTPYRRDWGDSFYQYPPLLVVDDGTGCVILTTTLPVGHLNSAYSATLQASAGCPDSQWTAIDGALPPGLILNSATGAITGTPGAEGAYPFTIQMTSSVAVRDRAFTINVLGDLVELTATGDVWVRQTHPDNVYENDGVSVWSSSSGNLRYGLIEFDVSGLAGLPLQSATLHIWSDVQSVLNRPMRQSAFLINSAGTPLTSLTWNSYIAEKDAAKVALARLGRYNLPANDPTQSNVYLPSVASQADLGLIAGEAQGDGKLSIVMIADEDSTDYRRDWGDSGWLKQPAKLTVLTGADCVLLTGSLPAAEQGIFYMASLEGSSSCGATPAWTVTNCFLPPGLELDPTTGLISGWPKHAGQFDFTVQVTPTGSGEPQQADLSINVAASPADLDSDGDVDPDDFTAFEQAFTGPGGAPGCTLEGSADDLTTMTAVEDVWLRESAPDTLYENDLISVWSTTSGNRRYGLATFDLSSLAGQTIRGAVLELQAATGGTQQTRPIKQTLGIVPGRALNATWNSYHTDQDPFAQTLEGLRHEVPGPKDGLYKQSTPATAADLNKIQAIVNGDGVLTLVMKADEDGTDYRADWGDLGYNQQPPRLLLLVGPPCSIVTLGLPPATAGTPYSATLQTSGDCTGTLNWSLAGCSLPQGLTLDAATGVISGTPRLAGDFPFRVQLSSGEGLRTRDLTLTVNAGAKADFDQDGDVDLIDFDLFARSFSGQVGSRPFCGTVTIPSTDTPLAIPDGGSVVSTITVPGDLTIGDVNVFVDITHAGEEAVKAVLTSPTGKTVMLQDYSRAIGSFTPRTYDDEGTLQPAEPLSLLDGDNAAGTWTLTIYEFDVELVDNGVLNSWKLMITAQ